MNLQLLFEQVLVWFTIWLPVWASVLWWVKLNGRKWCLMISLILLATTVYLAWFPLRVPNVTFWLGYYTLFALVYIALLIPKYGFKQFNKVLAIAMLLLFVGSELWELPIFIYDFISKIFGFDLYSGGFTVVWFASHIRRIYTMASLILLVVLTKLHLQWKMMASLVFFFAVLTMPILLLKNGMLFSTLPRLLSLWALGIWAFTGIPNGTSLVDS